VDSISLELEVHAAAYDDSDVWMNGVLVIAINRKRPYDEDEIILVDHFLESLECDGDFRIFSCVCGLPSCAARSQGVRVCHRAGIVEWTDLDRGSRWQFERAKIAEDLARVRDEARRFKRFFAAKGIRYVGVGHDGQ
jgi:uncharacterized protein YqiB (DUF1249 family)